MRKNEYHKREEKEKNDKVESPISAYVPVAGHPWFQKVYEIMGGGSHFATEPNTEQDWLEYIRKGFPVDVLRTVFGFNIISKDELHDVVIKPRTLSHRKKSGALSTEESDKLMRLLRIKIKAAETFQSREKAETWLHTPNRALRGEIPIELVKTESGAALVEEELAKISWGIFV